MPRRSMKRNRELAEHLAESRLSHKGLARRVVEHAIEVGLDVRYDHTSVRRWLQGERPSGPAPQFIADVLSENLGRRVRPVDIGMTDATEPVGLGLEFDLDWSNAVGTVTGLWRGDMERRRFLQNAGYSLAVYPAASMRWLTAPGPDHPVANGRRRVGTTHVSAVVSMTRAFRDLDNRVGGGRARPSVVQYLDSEVAPLLRGSYNEDVGRALFSATAELTRVAGWMAYDDENHGLAQRYFVQSLRMARTAADQGLGAEILAAMSHQATYVGRAGDAVDLARVAQVAARRAGLGALESECHVVEAHGHAARGDAGACATALRAAEKALERAGEPPEWLAYFDDAYLSAKFAHCFRDLGDDRRAAHYAGESLLMNEVYVRGRALNLALLADAQAGDDPRQAVETGLKALDVAHSLTSRRSWSYLRRLRHRLKPHAAAIPEVAAFTEQIATATRA